jgi:hypothetical protein
MWLSGIIGSMFTMDRAESFGQQSFDWPPDELLVIVAEQALSLGVHPDDHAILVCHENRFRRKLKHSLEEPFDAGVVCGEARLFTHVAASSVIVALGKHGQNEKFRREEKRTRDNNFAKFPVIGRQGKYISSANSLPRRVKFWE